MHPSTQRAAEQTTFERIYLCSFCFNKNFIISPKRRRHKPKACAHKSLKERRPRQSNYMQFMQESGKGEAQIVEGNFASEFVQLNVLKGGILRCLFIKSETARIYQLSQHKVFFSFPFAQAKKCSGIPQIYTRIYIQKISFLLLQLVAAWERKRKKSFIVLSGEIQLSLREKIRKVQQQKTPVWSFNCGCLVSNLDPSASFRTRKLF